MDIIAFLVILEKVRVFNRCYKTLALAFDSNMTRVLPLSNGTNESLNKEVIHFGYYRTCPALLTKHPSRQNCRGKLAIPFSRRGDSADDKGSGAREIYSFLCACIVIYALCMFCAFVLGNLLEHTTARIVWYRGTKIGSYSSRLPNRTMLRGGGPSVRPSLRDPLLARRRYCLPPNQKSCPRRNPSGSAATAATAQ